MAFIHIVEPCLGSADGTEMLQHFLADETPLLSDNIQCIAIHPRTGQVMIGTDKGLCSYMSDASTCKEDREKGNLCCSCFFALE